jgi:hypothetical protein
MISSMIHGKLGAHIFHSLGKEEPTSFGPPASQCRTIALKARDISQ